MDHTDTKLLAGTKNKINCLYLIQIEGLSLILYVGLILMSYTYSAFFSVLNHFSHVQLFLTLWTIACQAPLSRLEYWNGFPLPSPGDLPNPGIEPKCPALQADSSLSEL